MLFTKKTNNSKTIAFVMVFQSYRVAAKSLSLMQDEVGNIVCEQMIFEDHITISCFYLLHNMLICSNFKFSRVL